MRFGVMGTTTHVVLVGGDEDALYVQARARLQELDRKWSRYSTRSEVAQLNRRGGRLTMVSVETYALVEPAIDAWWRTAGRFDPTTPRSSDDCHDVRLWPLVDGVTVPKGVELDLSGMARAYAADIVATELVANGAEGACVNVGGDVRCAGRGPSDEGWLLGVRSRRDEAAPDAVRHEVARVMLQDGAIATDRFNGREHAGPWGAATVVAAEAWQACAVVRALADTSADDADALLQAWSATALLFTPEGELLPVSGFEAVSG